MLKAENITNVAKKIRQFIGSDSEKMVLLKMEVPAKLERMTNLFENLFETLRNSNTLCELNGNGSVSPNAFMLFWQQVIKEEDNASNLKSVIEAWKHSTPKQKNLLKTKAANMATELKAKRQSATVFELMCSTTKSGQVKLVIVPFASCQVVGFL